MNYLRPSPVRSMAGLLLPALLSGCSLLKTPEAQMEPGFSDHGLESATVVYKPSKFSRGSAMRRRGNSGDPRTLSIIYPHPQKGRGHALVEVVVIRREQGGREADYGLWDPRRWVEGFGDAARRTMPGVALGKGVKEAKAIDISKHELDGIFTRLERTGFFWETSAASFPVSTTAAATADLTVDLRVVVNGARFEQAWPRVDALDELLHKVRRKGRLITYRHSAAESLESSSSSRQSPEQLYRQLTRRRENRHPPRYDGSPPPHVPTARINRLPPIAQSY